MIKKNRYLFIPIITYISLCFYLYINQKDFIYFPNSVCRDNSNFEKIINNNSLIGYKFSQNTNQDILVIFHGNGGSALDRSYYFNLFPEQQLFFFEYPGYCGREKEILNKENIIKESRLFLSYIKEKNSNNKISLLGESLGSGIASQLAYEFNVDKLILVTPYSSIDDIASHKFSFLPISFLLTENYDNIKNLSQYDGKTLIITAEKDLVIPIQFSNKVIASVEKEKNVIVIKNAEHNDWFSLIDKEQINNIQQFLTH